MRQNHLNHVLDPVIKYIENQKERHYHKSFEDEIKDLKKK